MLCLLLFFVFKEKTAYEMRISDWSSDVCSSDLPPVMWSLSIRVGLVFGWGQCTHRQCVDFGLHAVAQRRIHQLVATNKPLAFKGRADDQGLEMCAVALDLELFAFQVVGNILA